MAPPLGPPGERRLLAACLQVGRTGRGLAQLAGAELAWPALLAMAVAQDVAQTVWQALMEEDAAGQAPSAVQEALLEAYQNTTAANSILLDDLARIQAHLERAGLPSVALKGAALLAAHYPAVGARFVLDVDLLVGPADLEAAAGVLVRAGLKPVRSSRPALAGTAGAEAVRQPWAQHLPPMVTWGGLHLELHDHLPGGGPAPEEVLARRRRVEWEGRPLLIPSPMDLVGTACLHTLVAHRPEWPRRTRLVADLFALSAAGPLAWDEVRARYGAGDGGGAVDAAMALLEAARREAAGEGRAPRRLGFLESPPAGVAMTEGLRACLDFLGKVLGRGGLGSMALMLFPSRRFMEARFGLRPGSALVWLLYPWRLLRGVRRALRPRR